MTYGYFDLYASSGLFVYPYSLGIKWADAWKKKKSEKSDHQPIKYSVQRERQYSLMTSPRGGREITIVSACSQERLWSDCAGTQAAFCWAHAIL